MNATPAMIARACEEVCARLNLGDDAELVIALAVEAVVRPPCEPGLTRRQNKLVHTLRAAQGRVVSREHLCAVMGAQVENPRNLISTMLVHIRAKRPDIGARIETVWGVGCRWRCQS
jgi:DNA-binding response OmpR family regulator